MIFTVSIEVHIVNLLINIYSTGSLIYIYIYISVYNYDEEPNKKLFPRLSCIL